MDPAIERVGGVRERRRREEIRKREVSNRRAGGRRSSEREREREGEERGFAAFAETLLFDSGRTVAENTNGRIMKMLPCDAAATLAPGDSNKHTTTPNGFDPPTRRGLDSLANRGRVSVSARFEIGKSKNYARILATYCPKSCVYPARKFPFGPTSLAIESRPPPLLLDETFVSQKLSSPFFHSKSR